MQPVIPRDKNFTYTAPEGQEKDVADLHVRRGIDPGGLGMSITSLWKPSEEELACLLAGAGVALTIYGSGHPVVSVGVEYE